MSDQERPDEPKPIEDQSESFWAKFNYDLCVKIRKYATIFAAIMLVIVGVSKILTLGGTGSTAAQYVMTFYFIVIAVVMVTMTPSASSTSFKNISLLHCSKNSDEQALDRAWSMRQLGWMIRRCPRAVLGGVLGLKK